MSFDVKGIAAKRSKKTKHDLSEWTKVLESARTSLKMVDMDSKSLEHLAMASRSPEKFTVVIRLIYKYAKSHPNKGPISRTLLNYANLSPFDLSDWVDSINYFHEWLVKDKLKVDFLPMLKYLECCYEAPDAKEHGQTLMSLLQNMLDAHGYEAG